MSSLRRYQPQFPVFPQGTSLPQQGTSFPHGVRAPVVFFNIKPPAADIKRFTGPPHDGQDSRGASFML